MLLQLGEAPAAMPALLGGYRTWFEHAWDGPLELVDGRPEAQAKIPHPRDHAGIVVSGSAASLATATPAAWMVDAAELVRRAHEVGTPLLGVCFGHQLIGHAFGARVIANPWGWEVGTRSVELTPAGRADPLFAGLPARLRVNLTHRDIIDPATCPAELRCLAGNDAATLQAVAVGTHTWGVQFHPEVSGAIMRGYIDARRDVWGHLEPAELHASAEDCPDALALLRNFRALVLTS